VGPDALFGVKECLKWLYPDTLHTAARLYAQINPRTMKAILYILMPLMMLTSCTKPDEAILPLVGIFRAHIIGVAGPVDIAVSTDKGTRLLVDAPFNGKDWLVVSIKVSDLDKEVKKLLLHEQTLDCCTEISGEGFYFNQSFELNYTLRQNGKKQRYKLVGTKK
jgi:hypothetical protein